MMNPPTELPSLSGQETHTSIELPSLSGEDELYT